MMRIEVETNDTGSADSVLDAWGWDHLSATARKDSLLAALEWNNKKIKKEGYTRHLLNMRDQLINDLNVVQKEIKE